jgi:hypothetical protein
VSPTQRTLDAGQGADLILAARRRILGLRPDLMVDLGVAGLEDPHQGRGRELGGGGADFAEPLAGAEDLQELARLPGSAPEVDELPQEDRPGTDGEEEEDAEHHLGHRPRAAEGFGEPRGGGSRGLRDQDQRIEYTHRNSELRSRKS